MLRFIASSLFVICSSANASTLLFTNNLPADQTGATYLAGVQNIASAMAAGSRIHATITFPENGSTAYFFVDTTTAKCSVGFPASPSPILDPNPAGTLDYCSGIINMRPRIDNQADAIATSPLISGSLDTLGRYWYVGPSGVLQIQTGYAISWWAD